MKQVPAYSPSLKAWALLLILLPFAFGAAGCVAGATRSVAGATGSVAGATGSAPSAADDLAFTGPLPYRSLMPLSLIFPHPLPERAAILPDGVVETEIRSDYGTIFVDDRRGAERILVDGEFSRSSLTARTSLGSRVEVGVEIPFVRYLSGRFDDFIDDWHSVFGLSPGHRDEAPENRFGVNYGNGDGTFFAAEEDGFHLADIPLTVKVGLLDPADDTLGLALRGLIELPTGDDEKGFGSGKVDGGAGVLVEKRFGEWAFYLSADHVFRSTPDSFEGVRAAHVTHGSLAAEYLISPTVALVAQTDYQTRPLDGARLGEFVDPQWSGLLGAAFRLGESTMLRLSMAEGFTTESAPDFVVSAGLVVGF